MTVQPEVGDKPSENGILARLETAERMLAEFNSAPEIVNLIDFAEAARVFARQAKLGTESVNHATAIKVKAELKLAEVVDAGQAEGSIATQKEHGIGRPKGVRTPDTFTPTISDPAPRPATLDEIGVDRRRLNEARTIRDCYTAESIDELVEVATDADITVARSELLAQARRQKQLEERRRRDAELVDNPPDLTTLDTFPVLYVDPPWRYEHSISHSREIENQYPTMTHDELCALPVPADDDAVLLMWVTSPKLAEGLAVMQAWGFDYRTSMVWIKDRIGMGYYARQRHELLLIGRKGDAVGLVPDEIRRPDSVLEARRGTHSAKPEAMYDLIDGMWPHHAKVELFARTRRDGWAAWGNQA